MNEKIGFIGAGRVAAALAGGLNRAGYRVAAVASRSFASAQRLAGALDGFVACPEKQAVADVCDTIFITTPDDAIPLVAAELTWRGDQAVIHCSGTDSCQALAAASRQGARVGVFHPLQTFAGGPGESSALRGITFSVEAAEPLLAELKDMAEALGGRWVVLKAEDKALYHAAAVMACNYLVALTKLATDLWAGFGVGTREATLALLPLMKGTLGNIERVGLPGCLTGPIARGDSGTVAKHLSALHDNAPRAEAAYRALGMVTLEVARAKGSIDRAKASEIAGLLTGEEATNDA